MSNFLPRSVDLVLSFEQIITEYHLVLVEAHEDHTFVKQQYF